MRAVWRKVKVRVDTENSEPKLTSATVDSYIRCLHLSIDHVLGVSYRRNLSGSKSKFVARVTLVKGTPFYGYHEGYKPYLKIYLLNPLHMTRLSDLLRQGAVLKKAIQPYESHLQYLLQWMCDYNLYGCDYVSCKQVRFRQPVPRAEELEPTLHLWHDQSIPPLSISDEADFPRLSHCSIEVDICVQNILNRQEINARPIHHDFTELFHPPPLDEKLVHSMASLWRDETMRRKSLMRDSVPDPDSTPFPAEALISMSAEPRLSQKGGWIHEAEYIDEVRRIISKERWKDGKRNVSFESFAKKALELNAVRSTIQSVEDLFPENLPNKPRAQVETDLIRTDKLDDTEGAIEVDESRIVTPEGHIDLGSDEEVLVEMERAKERNEGLLEQTPTKGANANPQNPLDSSAGSSDSRWGSDASWNVLQRGGPTTAAEMAAYGIYDASRSSRAAEVRFDIPLEYTNGSAATSFSLQQDMLTRPNPKRCSKRQKTFHDQATMTLETHLDDPVADGRVLEVESVRSKVEDGKAARAVLSLGQSQRESTISPQRSFTTISQECIKAHANNNSRTSAFSVVKDPREPKAIRKPSQEASYSENDHGALPAKSVSFTSAGKEASKSRESQSSAFRSDSFTSHKNTREIVHSLLLGFETSSVNRRVFCIDNTPPTADLLISGTSQGLMPLLYQHPYYSNEADVPARPREYAGRGYWLGSNTVPFLPDFDPTNEPVIENGGGRIAGYKTLEKLSQQRRRTCTLKNWEYCHAPPTQQAVEQWYLRMAERAKNNSTNEKRPGYKTAQTRHLSQIDGPTQKHRHGFKYSQKRRASNITRDVQYMSLMSLEVHVNTRDNLVPNPEEDDICCVFWCHKSDDEPPGAGEDDHIGEVGILVVSEHGTLSEKFSREVPVHVEEESTELNLINRLIDIVRFYDPDILTGYEVHGGSWGYIIERARCKYDYNLCDEFSRMKSQSHGRFGKDNDRWGFNHTSTIRVTGRHMINIWRAMSGELNLLQYTLENVAFHLLHKRIPHYSHKDLTAWYKSDKARDVAKVLDYFISRVQVDLQILDKNELILRTSEQARILGVDFFSVFSRGSQFKVESLMFRIAKAENFVLVSPSRKQVGQQNALECLPLVMEPQSDFYNSPLLVLDFQSLYPSIMIAYNYCYSTFLGRIVSWRGQNKMGFMDYKREPRILELLENQINGTELLLTRFLVMANAFFHQSLRMVCCTSSRKCASPFWRRC